MLVSTYYMQVRHFKKITELLEKSYEKHDDNFYRLNHMVGTLDEIKIRIK